MLEGECDLLELTVIDKNDPSRCSINEHSLDSASTKEKVGSDSKLYKTGFESAMDELIDDAVWDVCVEVLDTELILILDELVDDAIWDVCFEVHRSAKLGNFYLECPTQEPPKIAEDSEKDIHGQALKCKAQSFQISCPKCKQKACATKFASHLAKCIGISGRNSSRTASQKIANLDENKSDYDSDYSQNSNKKRTKKGQGKKNATRKQKVQGSCVSKSSIEMNANYQEMTYEQKKAFFNQMCGVISKHKNKMCMNTLNCSAHTDMMRRDVRESLLRDMGDQLTNDGQIDVDTVDEGSGGLSLYMQTLSTFSTDRHITSVSGFSEKGQPSSSKNSSSSFRKKKMGFSSSSSISNPSQIVAAGSSFESL